MSMINIKLPDWLADRAKRLADEDKVSLDQFVVAALAEKVSTLKAAEYLEERGRRGDRQRFLAALKHAPDVEPDPSDRIQ
jgi:hypothetical protein